MPLQRTPRRLQLPLDTDTDPHPPAALLVPMDRLVPHMGVLPMGHPVLPLTVPVAQAPDTREQTSRFPPPWVSQSCHVVHVASYSFLGHSTKNGPQPSTYSSLSIGYSKFYIPSVFFFSLSHSHHTFDALIRFSRHGPFLSLTGS